MVVRAVNQRVQEASPPARRASAGLRKGLLPPPLRVQRANTALTAEPNEVTGTGVPEWPPRLTKGSLSESSDSEVKGPRPRPLVQLETAVARRA